MNETQIKHAVPTLNADSEGPSDIGSFGPIRPLPTELIVLTEAQTCANAEKLFPSAQRPTSPVHARSWDQQKQFYVTARAAIEHQRAAFLDWSKSYALENNLDLQTIVLNGHARQAYSQWRDSLCPPSLATQEEILAAADEIYSALSPDPDDQFFCARNRATFIQEAQVRLQKYEFALFLENQKQKLRAESSSAGRK